MYPNQHVRSPLQIVFLGFLTFQLIQHKNFVHIHFAGHKHFDIHNFFSKDLVCETTEERHKSVQAIRNFADASSITLRLFRQPGFSFKIFGKKVMNIKANITNTFI
jgi:hypothetical protein